MSDYDYSDEEEREVMPGVFLTTFKKNKKNIDDNDEENDNSEFSNLSEVEILEKLHEMELEVERLKFRKAQVDSEKLQKLPNPDDFLSILSGMTLPHQREQVEFMINTVNTEISQLRYTQEQLRLFLAEDPEDQIISEALTENEPIIEMKLVKLEKLKSYRDKVLGQMGDHYKSVNVEDKNNTDNTKVDEKNNESDNVSEDKNEEEGLWF